MKSDKTEIVDLLSDESFLNYCKKSSPPDVAFWEKYLTENPDQRLLIEEANEKFVQLFNALAVADRDEQESRLKNSLNSLDTAPIVQREDGLQELTSRRILPMALKLTAAAAVLLLAVLSIINYISGKNKSNKIFMAAYGERKSIQLPDGSDVTLNGGSKIELRENFGISTRDVYLDGEAFFDVKHNVKLPFIVHTPFMDVKAVGTAFNVKAYLDEKITETSLIRGLVEVTLKEVYNRIVTLYPNQKIKWEHPSEKREKNNSLIVKRDDTINTTDSLMRKLVVTDNGDIKEIAWKENKLIFEDELFGDIAILLERWYGAKIEFKDDAIRNYRFTGVFEKEDLNTVLDFLKESRSFNYTIETGGHLTVNLTK